MSLLTIIVISVSVSLGVSMTISVSMSVSVSTSVVTAVRVAHATDGVDAAVWTNITTHTGFAVVVGTLTVHLGSGSGSQNHQTSRTQLSNHLLSSVGGVKCERS